MENKEMNFVSAVVYLHNDERRVQPFFSMLAQQLGAHFNKYEIVCVNDASTDASTSRLKEVSKQLNVPVTLINMSLQQGVELCMNAGLDMAIGDFVYEFDTLCAEYDTGLVFAAYQKSLEGNDIVSVSPAKNRNAASGLFYKLFNAFSRSRYKLQTDTFRLLSRRAINRVHAISENLPYRKAAYAASGLRLAALTYEGAQNAKETEAARSSRAIDSLILYTDVGYKASLTIAGIMLVITLAELVYTLCVFLGGGNPVAGWTTTMLVLTAGFFGVFLILALVIKYLSLLVELVFKKQKYLVESIEKLQS